MTNADIPLYNTTAWKSCIKAIERMARKYPMKESTRMHRQNAFKFRMKKWESPIKFEPKRFIEDIHPNWHWD